MSKIERLSHYGILVIALSAVFVSIWQVRTSQRHNRLTVMPYMDYFVSEKKVENGKIREYSLSNEGFGPAIINNIVYKYENEAYLNFEEVFEAINERDSIIWNFNYGPGTVISPGTKLKLIGVKKSSQKRSAIDMIITFESIYKDRSEKIISM